MSTLYQRLGGHEAISLVVDKFYELMLQDDKVKHYFNNTDMNKQTLSQKQFIALVCGGPNEYQGKNMKSAHKGMGISHVEFDATWENLHQALTHYNVPQQEINELKAIFYSVEEEIIENTTETEPIKPEEQEKSLYEKLGGYEAVKLVVNKFYDFMLQDDRVSFYFANTDMDKQRDSQVEFISMVTGGPILYKGKDMKTAHCPYKITEREFTATWENLHHALNVYNVPNDLINELKEVFYSVEGDIVNSTISSQHISEKELKCPSNKQVSIKEIEQQINEQSLYERLGGHGALYLVVNKFYDLVLENPKINFYFTNTDMAKQRNSQLEFLSMVTGGSMEYKGKDMKSAHCPYRINELEFDETWLCLEMALKYFKVNNELIEEVKGIFYSVEEDIVREHEYGKREHKEEKLVHEQIDKIEESEHLMPVTNSSPKSSNLSPKSPQNEKHEESNNCPFAQHLKISEQEKRLLRQEFIQKEEETKQTKKLSNSPYQKTFY